MVVLVQMFQLIIVKILLLLYQEIKGLQIALHQLFMAGTQQLMGLEQVILLVQLLQ